jgi:hypothetical protein
VPYFPPAAAPRSTSHDVKPNRTALAGALLAAALTAAIPAQTPTPNGAGFGALYFAGALDPQTGNATHLGVAVDGGGNYFVSAAGPAGGPHLIYKLDRHGNLLGSFAQPAVHDGSGFGIRDLEWDGQSLLGGSEAGISVFATDGTLAAGVVAANGVRPIVQPIRGAVANQLAVFRAIALDPAGNGGNGSLLVADFGSPIYEIDLAGAILRTFPNQGWSAYGLAIDPVTGDVWVHAGPNGEIEELARATMTPTGRRLRPITDGAPGGLALASPQAGDHEPWANRAAFVHLVQGSEDRIAVQRLHLFAGVHGWSEPVLEVGKNSLPPSRELVPFWVGDTLTFRVVDPIGTRVGWPAWVLFNVYLDANRDAYTDLSPVIPGTGVMWEHRTLNAASVPGTPNWWAAAVLVGSTYAWSIPVSVPLLGGDLFRVQAVYIEPSSPQAQIASTNEGNWQAVPGERGIVVAAEGATSFHAGQGTPFWRVRSDSGHGHGAILAVELSTVGAGGTAALHRFDIDQNGMNDRFDGGNSTAPGFLGTYRNGSAALCGLDFLAPGVHVAPFHQAGQSAGAGFSVPPDASGNVPDLRFRFTAFTPGKVFEFDCDTDGGPPSGADHDGLIVRVTTANSGVLTGVLQVDPTVPGRAVVFWP